MTTPTTETATATEKESLPKRDLYEIIAEKLESLSIIKFAAYRVACKLRVLQKYLKFAFVDYNILVRAFNSNELPFGAEIKEIPIERARNLLRAIYELISPFHFNQSTIEETVETFLRYLNEILHDSPPGAFEIHSFKIVIFTLSNAKLPEKYRCFFREITTPNATASQAQLTELFEILLKLPNYFDNVEPFHVENIPACVQSCLDHTHDGIIREEFFVNWMSREPQTLVWLPTFHRLIATETVRHEAQCNNCKSYPVIGMRYRCLRCFNYDLCQRCFFTGDHGSKHDGSHPIEEYCKQVTPFEDFKAFLEFMKLRMGKNELRRKERYLTIERSKSFSDTPNPPMSTSPQKNSHQSLNRVERKMKKTNEAKSEMKSKKSKDKSTESVKSIDHPAKDSDENITNSVPDQPIKIIKHSPSKTNQNNEPTITRSIPISYEDENDAPPILVPKQQKRIENSKKQIVDHQHYQMPPNAVPSDDDETPPPLPPKLRHQTETSRSLVYDFIGNELQELRATLAQFEKSSSTA